MSRRIEVAIPVFASVGPVYLRLFPFEAVQTAVDDYDARPWAWGALCRVKFHFGDLVTTKTVRQRYAFYGPDAWASSDRPSDADLAAGRAAVLDNLRMQIARHGFKPPAFEIIEVKP